MEDFAYGLGWLKDLPDFRDFTVNTETVSNTLKVEGRTETVKDMLTKTAAKGRAAAEVKKMDLRPWCSPVENQGSLGSCTAHAAAGMIEYFERRAYGKHLDASRLFIYKATRNMLGWSGDTGAYLRTTMGALALFGAPPENHWPYLVSKFDEEPGAFLYAYAQSFQAMTYYRLDPVNSNPPAILANLKKHLASYLPAMFGFTCYTTLNHASTSTKGEIPFPSDSESRIGGHAVLAVGFDDAKTITHPVSGKKTKGAILIRNSWGKQWGEEGYGWLPYEYINQGIAEDFWCLINKEYVETGCFKP